MIPRYWQKALREIWDGNTRKFSHWLTVGLAVLRVREALQQIPAGTADQVTNRTWMDSAVAAAIDRRDTVIKHDLNAFIEMMRLQIILGAKAFRALIAIKSDKRFHKAVDRALAAGQGNADASWFHDGMTSYDTEEGAFALLLGESSPVILAGLDRLIAALVARAIKHRGVLKIGRTHGQHAQPMTFGIECITWLESVRRVRANLAAVMAENCVMKLSGAVGVYGMLPPAVEEAVAAELNLRPVIATQIVPLEIRARLMNELALSATVVEKVADDLWHLAQTEIGEIREPFGQKQKGSAAMPHKKNPIGLENVRGSAQLVQGYAATMLRLVAVRAERDIAHSSAERLIWPDAFGMLDHLIQRLAGIVEKMEVFPERMLQNLELTRGCIASQRLEMLLKRNGLAAETAYRAVQAACSTALSEGRHLRQTILEQPEAAAALTDADLDGVFDWANWVQEEPYIYGRAGIQIA
ncbi:adenylosuccinate lyase [Candidatus Falkowbacteria bacterium]|nr:adenylosuccinate lyase [Candidatus Falkowbacteria bacterium]